MPNFNAETYLKTLIFHKIFDENIVEKTENFRIKTQYN